MRSLVLCLYLFIVCGLVMAQEAPVTTLTPNDMFKAAAKDLTERVAPEKRLVTRYLDIHAVPDDEKEAFIKRLVFAINSTSLRTEFYNPILLNNNTLMRLDLEDLGWDKKSRQDKLNILERFGVKFEFKDETAKALFVDIWERFTQFDKFFRVTATDAKGNVSRGWLDPVIEAATRQVTFSRSFILHGDWLLPRLLLERKFGGFYSDILFFPPKEQDLYKAFGVNTDFIDANNQLKQGGAVLRSIVALNNRELQLIPSPFGFDEKFIWRTFDINKAGDADKSVIQTFAGTMKHDGREIIGSLPNGLHWYYLADGQGTQVADVPPDIAQDRRQGPLNIRERRVLNAYKCISCHGEAKGTYPFQDVVLKAIKNPEIALTIISKNPEQASVTKQALEEYYNSKLGRTIARQQQSYQERVKECNGLDSAENSEVLVNYVEDYIYDNVSPERAAREMGVDINTARSMWKLAGNPIAAFLLSGEEVSRTDWENAFGDVMRSVVPYPWENQKDFIKVKVQ